MYHEKSTEIVTHFLIVILKNALVHSMSSLQSHERKKDMNSFISGSGQIYIHTFMSLGSAIRQTFTTVALKTDLHNHRRRGILRTGGQRNSRVSQTASRRGLKPFLWTSLSQISTMSLASQSMPRLCPCHPQKVPNELHKRQNG